MGFLDGLLGGVENAVSAPFNAVGDIFNHGGNLGDLLTIGSTLGGFGVPGLSSVPWGTINTGAHLLGLGQGSQGLYGGQGAPSSTGSPNYEGERLGAIQNAYNALNPANYGQITNSFGNQAQARAGRTGQVQASRLKGAGYGSGAQQGAKINAMNQANDATNQYASGLANPLNQAKGFQMQAGLLDPYSIGRGQLFNNYLQSSAPPSFLEKAFPILGQGLGQVFGHRNNGGSGGGDSSYNQDFNDYFTGATDDSGYYDNNL